jgi:hypothetical protein
MTFRQAMLIALLAIAGLIAAAAMGVAANAISGDSIGLSAEPLHAGDRLAPPLAQSRPKHHARNGRHPSPGSDGQSTTGATTTSTTATSPIIDDHGGNSGPGSSGSGSGSTSSGSGSGSSGSGSGSSGGSDD